MEATAAISQQSPTPPCWQSFGCTSSNNLSASLRFNCGARIHCAGIGRGGSKPVDDGSAGNFLSKNPVSFSGMPSHVTGDTVNGCVAQPAAGAFETSTSSDSTLLYASGFPASSERNHFWCARACHRNLPSSSFLYAGYPSCVPESSYPPSKFGYGDFTRSICGAAERSTWASNCTV